MQLLKVRSNINPYRFAARVVYDRLLWDLNSKSIRSRYKLKTLCNKHFGGKCVIVCNGPSLLKTNFSLLSNIYCFGLNKINLLFEKVSFRPNCIVAVNDYVIEQNLSFYNSTNIDLFLSYRSVNCVKERDNVIFLHTTERCRVARDASFSIVEGGTVTATALQVAFHMGFRDVALIGCDHSFATKGPANAEVESPGNDRSHFDPKYFDNGQKWQLPDLPMSEFFYSLIGEMFAENGGRVVNATDGGNLDVFKRLTLSDWIESKI